MNTKTLIRTALTIALIAIGAQIKLPSPIAGYFTLQLPAVIITACILGKKQGSIAVLIYLLGGLIGIPWFAGGGGIGYILKPTFGFLIGFVALAYITGTGHSKKYTWIYAVIGTFFVWLIGMVYLTSINRFYLGLDSSYSTIINVLLSVDLAFDFVLAIISTLIGKRVFHALEVS